MASVDDVTPAESPDSIRRSLPGSPFSRRKQPLFHSQRTRRANKRLLRQPTSSSSLLGQNDTNQMQSERRPCPQQVLVQISSASEVQSTQNTPLPGTYFNIALQGEQSTHLSPTSPDQQITSAGPSTVSVESGYKSNDSQSELLQEPLSPKKTGIQSNLKKEKHPNSLFNVNLNAHSHASSLSVDTVSNVTAGHNTNTSKTSLPTTNDHSQQLKQRISPTKMNDEGTQRHSDAAMSKVSEIYKDVPRNTSPDRPRSFSTVLLSKQYSSEDTEGQGASHRSLQASFSKFRRQSIDEGQEIDYDTAHKMPSPSKESIATPKPSQSPVMTQSKQDEKLSLPEPTTFSSMDEMYLWLQKTVKRIEENVAKIACENNKRVESVEKKYREMKSHFEELEAYVHKSAIVMSSSPSQISLPQSCEGSFDEGTTETELSAKSSESLSVQLMFKCNMTPSSISSSSVPSNLLCPPSHQPLVPKSSLPPDQRHVKRKSQAPPEDLPLATIEQVVILDLVKLTPKWQFIARRLEISEPDIIQIRKDYSDDVHEQCFQMFEKWKALSHPDDYNYRVLGAALRDDLNVYQSYVSLVHKFCHL